MSGRRALLPEIRAFFLCVSVWLVDRNEREEEIEEERRKRVIAINNCGDIS